MLRVFVLGCSMALLSACASQVPLEQKSGASTGSSAEDAATAKSALQKVRPSVYFDFDSYEIKSQYQATVSAFANYLKSDPKARLVIEGNADERGTTEYNLSLGQKRAEAVSKAVGVLGIAANRIEAVSNGEEKPRAKGSNEKAWAENRRADLILK